MGQDEMGVTARSQRSKPSRGGRVSQRGPSEREREIHLSHQLQASAAVPATLKATR